MTSAGQWVCANLKRNNRVPGWWREILCLLQCPSDSPFPKLAHQQATVFWLPTTQLKKDGLWTASACLEVYGWRKYLPLKGFNGSHDYFEVRKEEMVTLTMALQSCSVWSGTPLGVLCGVVQELCQCPAPLLEGDSLLNVMLDVAEKDPVIPAPASAPNIPTPEPEEEKQILQVPKEPCASEPEKAAHLLGGLHLTQGRFPAIPPGSAHMQANWTHAALARGIPPGAQLDLCSLGSLQVTITHGPAAGEVWYEYQSEMVTQASL